MSGIIVLDERTYALVEDIRSLLPAAPSPLGVEEVRFHFTDLLRNEAELEVLRWNRTDRDVERLLALMVEAIPYVIYEMAWWNSYHRGRQEMSSLLADFDRKRVMVAESRTAFQHVATFPTIIEDSWTRAVDWRVQEAERGVVRFPPCWFSFPFTRLWRVWDREIDRAHDRMLASILEHAVAVPHGGRVHLSEAWEVDATGERPMLVYRQHGTLETVVVERRPTTTVTATGCGDRIWWRPQLASIRKELDEPEPWDLALLALHEAFC